MSVKEIERIAKEGGDEATAKLYELLKPITIHIANQYTRSPSDVDDLLSEANIVLMKCREAHDPERGGSASFRTYYIRAIHNRFARFYKANDVVLGCDMDIAVHESDEQFEDLFDYSHDDGTNSSSLVTEAAAFAQTMPEKQRKVVTAILGGMSLHTYAEEEGIDHVEAGRRLRRGVESLMVHIEMNAPHLAEHLPHDLRVRFGGGEKPLLNQRPRIAQ